jgi:RNA polymerase sigma-70 factor (ECF subfamily)
MPMPADSEPLTGSTLLVLQRDPADARAWDGFVRRYGLLIYRWCRRWRLQDADAENITQEVLTRLVQKLRTFSYDPLKGTFRGWLRTLAQRAWSDYVTKNREANRGTGDSEVLERLQTVEARADLMESLARAFDLDRAQSESFAGALLGPGSQSPHQGSSCPRSGVEPAQ